MNGRTLDNEVGIRGAGRNDLVKAELRAKGINKADLDMLIGDHGRRS